MDVPIPTSNAYVNPAGFPTPELPNEGYRVWLALVIMIIASGLLIAVRFATRISAGQVGGDDYAILAALVSCLTQTVFWALSVRAGYGADYLKLSTPQRELFNKYWFFGGVFYPLTLALFKTSVILLNKRIFVQRSFQIICWVTLVINSCWALGNILGTIFQCIPIPIMWGAIPVTEGVCFDQDGLWISLVSWDVSSDVWILSMSIPLIWKLNLRLRERAMLTGVFALGAMVIIFSLMSCSAVVSSLKVEDSQTNTYTFGLANLFQVLESNMGIIGACLPIMKQPLKQRLPWLFSSSKTSNARTPYYDSDDRFTNQYVLQNVGSQRKGGTSASWHNVSISGPELFRSARRKSDELGIIRETADVGERDSGGDVDSGSSSYHHAIRKDVLMSVDRR